MTRTEIQSKIQDIFREVFDRPDMVVKDDTNSSNVDDWDSLNHINLVSAIEQELHIKFSLGELQSIENVGEMINLIMSKKS